MKKENLEKDVVYILLSPSQKTFLIFIGHKNSLREAYRHHLALHRLTRERYIRSLSPERPCIFILEEIDLEERANLLLVWLKILQDQGYMLRTPNCPFVLYVGTKKLVKRSNLKNLLA